MLRPPSWRERMFLVLMVPAPPWNDGMDTSDRKPPSFSSGDGAPPAKDRRLFGPGDLIEDDSRATLHVSATPETVHDSPVPPGTPPTASVLLTQDQIAAMVASSLEKARRENQPKVDADNNKASADHE